MVFLAAGMNDLRLAWYRNDSGELGVVIQERSHVLVASMGHLLHWYMCTSSRGLDVLDCKHAKGSLLYFALLLCYARLIDVVIC